MHNGTTRKNLRNQAQNFEGQTGNTRSPGSQKQRNFTTGLNLWQTHFASQAAPENGSSLAYASEPSSSSSSSIHKAGQQVELDRS